MSLNSLNRGSALLEYLKILGQYLADDSNTEIVINRPGEVKTESIGGWQKHNLPSLTYDSCLSIAKLTATYSNQSLDQNKPIISATLPHGERIQIVIPPATLNGRVSITIRKPANHIFSLDDYEKQGAFEACADYEDGLTETEKELISLKNAREYKKFLQLAVRTRQNIIVSGSTGSGKTTLMRSLVSIVPQDERLISIENVDELKLYESHENSVPLFYSAGGQGIASEVDQQQLLESSLRMRPDRIFLAELIRGDEAFYYLRNVNSGHPGSITSIHANSARLAYEQMVLFLKESRGGNTMSRADIKQLLILCIDIIIQVKNIRGKRVVTEIYYDPERKREQIA